VDPVVVDPLKDAEELLHPRPHFLAAVVDCVVLVVKSHVWRVELETRADVVAFGVDGCDVLFEESLSWRRGPIFLPLGAGYVADELGHGAVL
jgi:hypothetical protein